MQMALRSMQPSGFNMGGALGRIVAGDQPPFDLGDIGLGGMRPRNPLRLLPSTPAIPGINATNDEANTLPVWDTSPPGLPPANMPGGNQPTPLVQSDAQPDYASLLRDALGPRPELHGFRKVASILGPALMAATGNQAGASAMIDDMQRPGQEYDRRMQEAGLEAVKWGRADDEAKRKQNEPQYFSGSEDRLRFDPATNTTERVYDAPQDFEDYASARGMAAGTPGFAQAVEDYRLGAWSDPAVENRSAFETMRAAARLRETRERLAVTRRGQDLGSSDRRYSVDRGSVDRRYSTDAASGDRRRGQDIGSRDRNRAVDVDSRDRRESASFRGTGGRGGAGGGAGSAARIVDPKTGRAAVVKNGKWVDEATGKPLS